MTDMDAIEAAATNVWSLACQFVFPGGEELLKEFPELTVDGESFRIAFRLQQDLVDRDRHVERTMIALRFMPPGQRISGCPPTLYVRGHWPERTDRFSRVGPLNAKKLRKAFSPKRRPKDDPHRQVLLNDDVYVMEGLPPDDLTAQICLFVIQTERSENPQLMVWLEEYFLRNFRSRVPSARRDIARDVVVRLILNKWWAEDPKAWRKYVATVQRAVEHQYRQVSIDVAPAEDKHASSPMVRSVATNDLGGTALTVKEASRKLNVSASTLYTWIHRRRLTVEYARRHFLIQASELERLARSPKLSAVITAVAAARGCSPATARRFVTRLRSRGASLDDILREHVERR